MAFRFQEHVVYEQLTLFVADLYTLTGRLPNYEQTGLINSLRQLGNSLLQTFAAGFSRTPDNDPVRSLNLCIETLARIASLIDLGHHLGYITKTAHSHWIHSCEDLTKRIHEQIRSSK